MTRVLHVTNHSTPHMDGYSVRTSEIVGFQKALGFEPAVVTSPRHEPDLTGAREEFDGISYFRVYPAPQRPRTPIVGEWSEVRRFKRRILEVIDEFEPEVVHAHTPCLWGLAALQAARSTRLPVVYEIRGFWEDSLIDNGGNPAWSIKYRLSRRLEEHVVRNVDAVVTISDCIRRDLIDRGLPGNKMFLVPNGVDVERFGPLPVDEELQSELGLAGHPCLGYLGSFYNWEGIDDLVRAMVGVGETAPEARLLLVGGGHELERIKALIDELGLKDSVLLIGPVPRDQVVRYYSVMDVLVYPRKRSRTTELTTPLKPLEAMCMAKPVIASDVGGLRELFPESGSAVRYFESENVEDLTRACAELATADDAERARRGGVGREHVLTERRWIRIAETYRGVYEYASSQVAPAEASMSDSTSRRASVAAQVPDSQ